MYEIKILTILTFKYFKPHVLSGPVLNFVVYPNVIKQTEWDVVLDMKNPCVIPKLVTETFLNMKTDETDKIVIIYHCC